MISIKDLAFGAWGVAGLLSIVVVFLTLRYLYRLSPLHSLRAVPGPLNARLSSLVLLYHSLAGDETAWIARLHARYGSVVVISPHAVDISDGTALQDIYVSNGGFRKSYMYENFSPDGKHLVLFSETDPAKRQVPVRAVGGVFAPSSVKGYTEQTMVLAHRTIDVLNLAKKQSVASGVSVDVLGLGRAFAADAASINILGQPWDCLERCRTILNEGGMADGLRGDGVVDFYDGLGRYITLPPQLFKILEKIRFSFADKSVAESFNRLWGHVGDSIASSKSDLEKSKGSFQERLLRAGVTEAETTAHAADAIGAGVETTGFNIAVLMWHLCQRKEVYDRLKDEIHSAGPDADIRSLPYLDAVVREGCRIGRANPTRFPRIVPSTGYNFAGHHLPKGTEVSCTPQQLHFNPNVYQNPEQFLPERWLTASTEMKRDWIPFGLGARRCIAKDLAMMEMRCIMHAIASQDSLKNARCTESTIEVLEWFSVKAIGGRIDLSWAKE